MKKYIKKIVESRPILAKGSLGIYEAFRHKLSRLQDIPYEFKFIGKNPLLADAERELTEQILKFRNEIDVFVDIGAHAGFYTCLFRSLEKKTISIEPISQNLRWLYRNLEMNQWNDVEVWPLGLSESSGLRTFYGKDSGASLIKGWDGASGVWKNTCPVNTLDNVLGNRLKGRRLLIKIDVEGAELFVLKGAESLIKMQPRPIWVLEISLDQHRNKANISFEDTFKIFWDNGYLSYAATNPLRLVKKEEVRDWQRKGSCDFGNNNWIFLVNPMNKKEK